MDELSCQLLGNFSLSLLGYSINESADELPYIKLEWGADFHQHENAWLAGDQIPSLTTSSAHLARQLMFTLGGCAFLPSHWLEQYPELHQMPKSETVIRPCYAVWLENSDQQELIRQLLKTPIDTSV